MRITRPGMLVYVCNLSIEVEAGRLQIQGHPWLYSKLETNVDLRRPPSQKKKQIKAKQNQSQTNKNRELYSLEACKVRHGQDTVFLRHTQSRRLSVFAWLCEPSLSNSHSQEWYPI